MSRQVNIRVNDEDDEVLQMIRRAHPLSAKTDAGAVRVALEAWLDRNKLLERIEALESWKEEVQSGRNTT